MQERLVPALVSCESVEYAVQVLDLTNACLGAVQLADILLSTRKFHSAPAASGPNKVRPGAKPGPRQPLLVQAQPSSALPPADLENLLDGTFRACSATMINNLGTCFGVAYFLSSRLRHIRVAPG